MEWKKVNVVPVHKKDKQCIKETDLSLCFWSPVKSLEKSYSSNFERLLNKNDLLSFNQSGFQHSDPCIIYELLSIVPGIHQSFDNDLEVRGAFLDII